jgi:serine phosphatase RsbU (regulator of sigma subunit)
MKIYFSAANNQISIVRRGELLEFKGDKMSVGKHERDQELFTLHTVELEKGDIIYTFTDGYADQFGSSDKKLKSKVLKKMLLEISTLSMLEQKIYLNNFLEDWKGSMNQTDDILLIGVKIP